MKAPRLTKCPVKGCRGKVRRKIGAGAGFVFKGSGFYITDYRSEGYKAAAKNDAPPADSKPTAEGKPAGESKSTTDSKPAAESKPAADNKSAEPVKKEKKEKAAEKK